MAAAKPALLECSMAKTVIGGAFVAVLEDVIGLVDFLESMLAVIVAGIAMFSLKTPKSFSVSRLQISASSGTEP